MKKYFLLIVVLGFVKISKSQNIFPENGKVGIGTITPLEALDVRNGHVLIKNLSNQTGESAIMIDHSLGWSAYVNFGTSLRTYTENSGYNRYALQFFTQNDFQIGQTEKLRITGNGNVGIGTVMPEQKLSVAGNIFASVGSNEGAALILENSSKNTSAAGYRWTLYNMTGPYDNSLQFWNYNQDNSVMGPKFTISDDGNVLIGKNSQINTAYKLDVNGKARANEIVVNTTGADFVFEKDYKLRSLKEVEAFVKQNKHLPEIPKAKQMQENGVSLGELNTKLLQKVKELTLHLIEKDKELASERKTNKDQQVQIDQVMKELIRIKKTIKQ